MIGNSKQQETCSEGCVGSSNSEERTAKSNIFYMVLWWRRRDVRAAPSPIGDAPTDDVRMSHYYYLLGGRDGMISCNSGNYMYPRLGIKDGKRDIFRKIKGSALLAILLIKGFREKSGSLDESRVPEQIRLKTVL